MSDDRQLIEELLGMDDAELADHFLNGRWLKAARDEILRLREVVGKFPKTADGAHVTPASWLFVPDSVYGVTCDDNHPVKIAGGNKQWFVLAIMEGVVKLWDHGIVATFFAVQCYSTLDAARRESEVQDG